MSIRLIPKHTKYKKYHKISLKGTKNINLNFGNIGLYSLNYYRIKTFQIEAARKTILKYTKRQGAIFNRLFTDIPVTKKPESTRMGSGKGPVDHWVTNLKPGKMIFELKDLPLNIARQALKQVQYKLPIKTQIYEKKYRTNNQ